MQKNLVSSCPCFLFLSSPHQPIALSMPEIYSFVLPKHAWLVDFPVLESLYTMSNYPSAPVTVLLISWDLQSQNVYISTGTHDLYQCYGFAICNQPRLAADVSHMRSHSPAHIMGLTDTRCACTVHMTYFPCSHVSIEIQ